MIFRKKNDSETAPLTLPDNFRLIGESVVPKKKICEMIAETWLFTNIDKQDIKILAGYMQCYQVATNTVIFKEGDTGDYMCLLMVGQVGIFKEGQDGKRHHLASIEPGKTFGEMSIIDNERRSATCATSEDSLLLLLTRQNYGRIIQDEPRLAINILIKLTRLISRRLRNVSDQVVEHLDK